MQNRHEIFFFPLSCFYSLTKHFLHHLFILTTDDNVKKKKLHEHPLDPHEEYGTYFSSNNVNIKIPKTRERDEVRLFQVTVYGL